MQIVSSIGVELNLYYQERRRWRRAGAALAPPPSPAPTPPPNPHTHTHTRTPTHTLTHFFAEQQTIFSKRFQFVTIKFCLLSNKQEERI